MSGSTALAPTAGPAELEAARLLLARLGVTPADLLTVPGNRTVPLIADYIPQVAAATSTGTRRAYSPYWNLAIQAWGQRALAEVTALDISSLSEHARSAAVVRRNSRGGRGAAEHLIGALRCIYNHAVADGIIPAHQNPAAQVAKPRRLPSTRWALPDNRIAEITKIAATTGNDPELDALLIRLHLETACRRAGALSLTSADLDPEQSLIRLREKGGTVRWQPVSPTLMTHLTAHRDSRGTGDPGGQLLRYASGQPITRRRYDYLWNRIGQHLPWAAAQQVTAHWLRHTTLKWVERNFGYAIAQAYAGHINTGKDRSATTTYVRADLPEIAAALAALTGQPHPLSADTQAAAQS